MILNIAIIKKCNYFSSAKLQIALFLIVGCLAITSCKTTDISETDTKKRSEERVIDEDSDGDLAYQPPANETTTPRDTPRPTSTPVPIHSNNNGSFRAATWNLKTWFESKIENRKYKFLTGQDMSGMETLFETIEKYGIDIIALQEVYTDKFTKAKIPNKQRYAKYDIIRGGIIYQGIRRAEYAPIAWNTEVLTCYPTWSTNQTELARLPQKIKPRAWHSGGVFGIGGRGIHWVFCKVKAKPSVKFYFGSGHLSPEPDVATNIEDIFLNLADKDKKPVISRTHKDSFILGMDANSHPAEGYYQSALSWRTYRKAFNRAVGVATLPNGDDKPEKDQLIPFIAPVHIHDGDLGLGKNNPFTKIYKRHGIIKVTGTKTMQTIDELLISTQPSLECPGKNKQVLNFNTIVDMTLWPVPNNFWKAYHKFSDHMIVSTDCTY